jgi:hypothetical protein
MVNEKNDILEVRPSKTPSKICSWAAEKAI